VNVRGLARAGSAQHDLSASDRSWIQNKIDALKGAEEGDAVAALLPPVSRPFTVTGASQPMQTGRPASINIAAAGILISDLACAIDGATAQPDVSRRGAAASITWTPDRAGAYILICRAGKHIERRVLRVAAND
jgi:hypothetical protein